MTRTTRTRTTSATRATTATWATRATRATREPSAGNGLVLAVPGGGPVPPPLRFERPSADRLTLRQGARALFDGRLEGEGCCRHLRLRRLPGHRSPLPPLRAEESRSRTDWTHRYARWLEESAYGPLTDGRWGLTRRGVFPPGVWTSDLVRDWPHATLELFCGGGWHGVLPLRPLSAPDAPRVKAYRKHVREGTLAPVLLWWVSFLDGWVVLDGHDRAAAALAEGAEPEGVELARLPDDAEWRREDAELAVAYEERWAAQAARHPDERQRAALERGHADAVAALPYEAAATPVFDAARD
ncbi:hypothetical protein ACF068_28590 [Streptomyces sp. NPDC016309]|uniref:hypothetical protein n=1 Tax=Streptomyces sp. NPDC016309 TaxID=3364965 RepID=UPI0036FF9720